MITAQSSDGGETLTASSGTGSVTIKSRNTILMQIILNPATVTTTYDVQLIDVYNRIQKDWTSVTGEMCELTEIPSYGNWTLKVLNSTVDETFDYLLALRER